MSDIPQAGNKLTTADVEQIAGAIKMRQENFPGEPLEMTVALVLLNIGERWAPVNCVNGEWEGLKKDIPKRDGVPLCPNGHPMFQGFGLSLGWYTNE